MNIAFFGATGMLGAPVAKQFIKSGHNLRMLVRDQKKAQNKFGDLPEYVTGELENDSSVQETIKGCDAIINY
jgi:NAD dependent epimerase/dehydratase family enzyme